MTRSILFLFIILAATTLPTYTGESEKKPTEKEIKALIDKLVSPNPEPVFSGDEIKDSPSYDREKQKLVEKAFDDLENLGPQAFPFLIDRWDDKHFSLTTSYGPNGSLHNVSVGEVCKMIIFNQIQPFGCWKGIDEHEHMITRPDYPARFLSSRKDAKKWYEEHKNKSLAEIQLEVLDWVIAQEGKDVEKDVLELRIKLKDGKKPLPPGEYHPIEIVI
jgi:hypothetical protein